MILDKLLKERETLKHEPFHNTSICCEVSVPENGHKALSSIQGAYKMNRHVLYWHRHLFITTLLLTTKLDFNTGIKLILALSS